MDWVAGLVAVPVVGLLAAEVVTGAGPGVGAVAFGAAVVVVVVVVVAVDPAAGPGEVVEGRDWELAAAVG